LKLAVGLQRSQNKIGSAQEFDNLPEMVASQRGSLWLA
jgi:hypothetical protein